MRRIEGTKKTRRKIIHSAADLPMVLFTFFLTVEERSHHARKADCKEKDPESQIGVVSRRRDVGIVGLGRGRRRRLRRRRKSGRQPSAAQP